VSEFRWKHYYLLAPGFRIKEGPYKDIGGLCLDPSKIPEKTITLSSRGKRYGEVVGEVKLVRGSFIGKITWTPSKPKQHVKSVKLEICTHKIPFEFRTCVPLAETKRLEREVTGKIEIPSERKVFLFVSKNPSTIFENLKEVITGGKDNKIVGGYKERGIKARLKVNGKVVSETVI